MFLKSTSWYAYKLMDGVTFSLQHCRKIAAGRVQTIIGTHKHNMPKKVHFSPCFLILYCTVCLYVVNQSLVHFWLYAFKPWKKVWNSHRLIVAISPSAHCIVGLSSRNEAAAASRGKIKILMFAVLLLYYKEPH